MMDGLPAGWRIKPKGLASDDLPHVDLDPVEGKSIFETIEASGYDDEETYIVYRGELCYTILNVYPYCPGHVMVLPYRAVANIGKLTDEEYSELWLMVKNARQAIMAAFSPQGANIGVNEGAAGGGSIHDHLHVHVLPRWNWDTSFMSSIAEARVLPMPLRQTWEKLRENWPK